jgi:hypothetical protein
MLCKYFGVPVQAQQCDAAEAKEDNFTFGAHCGGAFFQRANIGVFWV